jgi:hypothetical protein
MHIKVFRLKAFLDLKLLVLTSNPFRKHCWAGYFSLKYQPGLLVLI